VIACHLKHDWSQICNGTIVFEDTGALLPDGTIIEPHRAASRATTDGFTAESGTPARCPGAARTRQ